MYPSTPIIKMSTDYARFKLIDWNRSVDATNVRKLLAANREKFQLHKFPILVSEDYKIIDGQHRYEVSKQLGAPIYYIVDGNDTSFAAVHSVNKAGKKHSLKDKIDMLHKAGDPGALEVFNIHNQFSKKFDYGTIAGLCITGTHTSGQVNASIDNLGSLSAKYAPKVRVLLRVLDGSNLPDKYTARMVIAVNNLCDKSGVSPLDLVDRVTQNLIKWVSPKSIDETRRSLAFCYNYGLTEKNRISFN